MLMITLCADAAFTPFICHCLRYADAADICRQALICCFIFLRHFLRCYVCAAAFDIATPLLPYLPRLYLALSPARQYAFRHAAILRT